MHRLSASYESNVALLDRSLAVRESFDIIKKVLRIGDGGDELTLYYIDGFVESGSMQKLLGQFLGKKGICGGSDGTVRYHSGADNARAFVEYTVSHVECECTDDPDKMITMMLSGATLVLGSAFGEFAVLIDSRTYPVRSVEEPQDDRVMKGARDGFVETVIFNTALIRRRIRDPRLHMEHHSVGSISKTDVILCYFEGKADPDYVKEIGKRLDALRVESLILGHESLIEALIKRKWYNPFPKVRTTGRPDAACAQILEGSVILLIDNSPEVLILPTSIFDFLQETNDFYFPPLTGGYLRIVRQIVFFFTLFLTPLWYLLTRYPSYVPDFLTFALPDETGKLPLIVQLLLVEFLIDGLRLASMNTPDMLSNSLSVVGGLILGDFAVEIGWLIPEVILYMAFVAIANFSQRSYQLGYAFKFLRILLLILTALFGLVGFLFGVILITALLLSNRTVNGKRSYLDPLVPLRPRALRSILFRRAKGSD